MALDLFRSCFRIFDVLKIIKANKIPLSSRVLVFLKKNPKVNPSIKNMSKLVRLGMGRQWPSL